MLRLRSCPRDVGVGFVSWPERLLARSKSSNSACRCGTGIAQGPVPLAGRNRRDTAFNRCQSGRVFALAARNPLGLPARAHTEPGCIKKKKKKRKKKKEKKKEKKKKKNKKKKKKKK